jgi:exosortase
VLSKAGQRALSTDSLRRLGIWRIVVILPLAGLYAPVFADLGRAWWGDQYAGHGMFVPAFSAFLAWNDRDRIRAAVGRPDPAGILVLLVALALLAAGRWSGSLLVQALSVVVAVAGALLWTCGGRCLRTAAFPVAFLVFMAPPPSVVVDTVTLHLQLFAARVAGVVLEILDVPFYQSGVDIVLPAMTLQVAEVCNGLRFLLALLVLTMACAYVSQRSPHRMAVLVASAIPIAILANAARVAAIAVAVQYVGPQAASGAIHNAIGKGVWALTLVPLAGIGFWLRGRGRSGAA